MPKTLINGVRLYHEIEGRGEPVALLNGVLMTAASWAPLRRQLVPHVRCILHDFRGQMLSCEGLEPEPVDPSGGAADGQAWSLQQHADDLACLLDTLGIESCHVVGTSYGGEVGLLFAASYPQRTRSLSVIASVAEVDAELARKVKVWAEASRHGAEALMRAAAVDAYSPAFLEAYPELIEQGIRRMASMPETFLAGFRRLVGAFEGLDALPGLGSISAPCLVVAAELDTLKPLEACLRMARAIPRCETIVIPNAGHAVVVEQPEPVGSAVLGFLMKHSRSRPAVQAER